MSLGQTNSKAITAEEFVACMASFEPFEPRARIACAVSGGVDSMALLSLLAAWCRPRGYELVVLHVDHGLREDAPADAAFVMRQAELLGASGHVLRWQSEKPSGPIQEAARQARYDLLAEQCRKEGLLHLILAHHRDDQAETVALRLQSGSGLAGLAGMGAARYLSDLRLLRPLLGVPKTRLQATLRNRGLDWTEDPSNRSDSHRRIRYRKLLQSGEEGMLLGQRLAAVAGVYGRLRAWSEAEAARCLAKVARVYPSGYALLEEAELAEAPEWLRRRIWFQLLRTIGGAAYGVRSNSLTAFLEARPARERMPETLGGCRILAYAPGWLLVMREVKGIPSRTIKVGETVLWDGRFQVSRPSNCGDGRAIRVGPLGEEGRRRLLEEVPALRKNRIPRVVWPSFPALFCLDGLLAVPHLNYKCYGSKGACSSVCRARPYHSLAEIAFRPAVNGL